ncbi:hypothetical protein AAIR98_000388 [Elusimicrobium simillimum]|uniref:hypothetical protein n=1 Tax=Elusimicrobium simillimum TaxID=3143438 RepID=UPI003C6F3EDD
MADKIWILNIDDFMFKSQAVSALKKHSLPYINLLKPADICIISPLVQKDEYFTAYVEAVKKLTNKKWIYQPKKQAKDQTLINAIMKDEKLIAQIKKLCKQNFVLIPLIYTEEFAKLSKKVGNKLLNNSIAVQEANNKLLFKELCQEFGVKTMKPVFEKQGGKNKSRVLAFIDFNETYLLRRPFSAGGYGNIKGKIIDLLPLIRQYHKDGDFYIEKFKEIYKTLGSLCILKDDGIQWVGIDWQFVHRAGSEGRAFPFKKMDKAILDRIKEKSLQMAEYYHKKGVRGHVNFDWAIRIIDGQYKLRALECNSRYNGFGIAVRIASTVFNIPKEKLNFYLDTNVPVDEELTTKDILEIIFDINSSVRFKGGIALTAGVKNGKLGVCYIGTSHKNVQLLILALKRKLKALEK